MSNQLNKGWIKLDRKMINWEFYSNPNVMRVFIHLLLIANIEPTNYKGVTIGRGSCHATMKEIAGALGITERQVRTALMSLKQSNSVSITRRSKFSIISIVLYDKYQGKSQSQSQSNGKSLLNKKKYPLKGYKEGPFEGNGFDNHPSRDSKKKVRTDLL